MEDDTLDVGEDLFDNDDVDGAPSGSVVVGSATSVVSPLLLLLL